MKVLEEDEATSRENSCGVREKREAAIFSRGYTSKPYLDSFHILYLISLNPKKGIQIVVEHSFSRLYRRILFLVLLLLNSPIKSGDTGRGSGGKT